MQGAEVKTRKSPCSLHVSPLPPWHLGSRTFQVGLKESAPVSRLVMTGLLLMMQRSVAISGNPKEILTTNPRRKTTKQKPWRLLSSMPQKTMPLEGGRCSSGFPSRMGHGRNQVLSLAKWAGPVSRWRTPSDPQRRATPGDTNLKVIDFTPIQG